MTDHDHDRVIENLRRHYISWHPSKQTLEMWRDTLDGLSISNSFWSAVKDVFGNQPSIVRFMENYNHRRHGVTA